MGRALRAELSVHDAGATVAHFGWIDTRMVRQGFAFERQEAYRSILRAADDPRNAKGTEGLTKAADAEDAATPAGVA